jgi:hypothetical protein
MGGPATGAGLEQGETVVRKLLTVMGALALVLVGFTAGSGASDRDETIMTVQVSSADHEIQEGYFTLGDSATMVAKPGSDLYKFLTRQRGRKVKVVLSEASGPELSRLER